MGLNGRTLDANDRLQHRLLGADPFAEARPVARLAATEDDDVPRDTWPRPLGADALIGVAGEFVRTIEPHTEADPAALLVQFLVAFGSVIGRGPHFQVEADRHGTNLFACLVGSTSKGRKGTSFGHVRRHFRGIDPDWRIVGGLSTGEGLISAVRDAVEREEPIRSEQDNKVTGYQRVRTDPGVSDKRLLALAPEFASVLKVLCREGNTLSPTLRDAWDGVDLSTLTKNSPATATGAHVSVIAHVTREELTRLITAEDAANGFGNRFLCVCTRRSKLLPEGGRVPADALREVTERTRAAIDHAHDAGLLDRDDPARAAWREAYECLGAARPGLLGAMTSRAEAQVVRLSLLYALLDRADRVGVPHLRAALEVWRYCDDSARYAFGASLGNRDAERLLAAIRGAPDGLTTTDVHGALGRHRTREQVHAALEALLDAGQVTRHEEPTAGRPRVRYRARREASERREEGRGSTTST